MCVYEPTRPHILKSSVGKICSAHVRTGDAGSRQVRPAQIRVGANYVCAAGIVRDEQVRCRQHGRRTRVHKSTRLHVLKTRAGEIRAAHVSSGDAGSSQVRPAQIRVGPHDVRAAGIVRNEHVRCRQHGRRTRVHKSTRPHVLKTRAGEIRAAHVRTGDAGSRQVRPAQIRVGTNYVCAAGIVRDEQVRCRQHSGPVCVYEPTRPHILKSSVGEIRSAHVRARDT